MISTVGLLLICAALFLVLVLIRVRRKANVAEEWQPRARHPYIGRGEFMPYEHQVFLQALQRALGDVVDICPRVAAKDMVKTFNQLPQDEWQYWNERLLNYSFDFLLMDRRDYSVVCAIDLQQKQTGEVLEDDFARDLCHAARVSFVRFQAASEYDSSAIRSVILAHLPLSTDTKKIDATATTQEIGLICPKCSSLLVRKVARKGPHAGTEFWACSSAPRCRHAEPVTA